MRPVWLPTAFMNNQLNNGSWESFLIYAATPATKANGGTPAGPHLGKAPPKGEPFCIEIQTLQLSGNIAYEQKLIPKEHCGGNLL